MRFQARPVTLFCCFLLSVFVLSGQSPSDSDNDLVPDAVEILWGMDPSYPADAMNVRFEFDVGSKPQVLYLDKVEFIRHGPPGD